MRLDLFIPIVFVQTYQATLNQKIAVLKKSEECLIEVNFSTQRLIAC
jgi:hypothetical protein